MRALRPVVELALAALAIVAVTLLARGAGPGPPPATFPESRHDPRTCGTCRHPVSRIEPMLIPGSEVLSPSPHTPWRAGAPPGR